MDAAECLKLVHLPSLELRRLHTDLIFCYKIPFRLTDLQAGDFFELAPLASNRGPSYKLYKKQCPSRIRSSFFSERVINAWNSLPESVDFRSLASFVHIVTVVDLSVYLRFLATRFILF